MIFKLSAIVAVTLSVAVLAACQREAATSASTTPDTSAPAASTAPASTIAAPASVAPPATVAAPAPAEPAAFDAQAFAGTYTAPGARLDVTAQGGYRLSVHAESANADLVSTGTWTADPDAKHVLLQPDSKDEPAQRFEVVSKDELRTQDGSRTLRRSGGP